VNGYARQFYTNPNFKPEFKKELREIYELASYKRVEKLESGGQMKEAADAYAAFYAEFPQSTYGDKALFNAAFLYFKTNNTQKAVDMREKLIAGFPKSELMGKNIDALAKLYESFASFKKAADYYEMLYAWDKDKTYPGTADAIYSAALFRNSLGDWQKAIANFQIYARDFAAKDDAHIAAFEIGRIYEQNGKPVEAAATYKKFYTDPAFSSRSQEYTFHARLRYGKLLRAQGQLDASYAAFQEGVVAFEKVSRSGGQLGAAPLFAAEMKFYLVEPAYEKFAKLKLELPKKGQKGNALEEKLRMAEEVARQYTAVLELKQGEWGIAALYQIGETYRNVADTLLEAPAPPALTEQQLQIFKAALADKAYPLKDKAAEALEQALSKSYELGIYNEYTAKAAGLLAQLKPREYPEQFEVLGTPNKLSDTIVTADFRR
jgi:outer membrane protein assembly factor BamD (BamD/ComL family)